MVAIALARRTASDEVGPSVVTKYALSVTALTRVTAASFWMVPSVVGIPSDLATFRSSVGLAITRACVSAGRSMPSGPVLSELVSSLPTRAGGTAGPITSWLDAVQRSVWDSANTEAP